MLRRGDPIPHFEVKTIWGETFRYATIWQRRNLVLLVVPAAASQAPGGYISRVLARRSEFTAKCATCVVTRDRLPGTHSPVVVPVVVVADRWGEIVHLAATSQVEDLTSPEGLLEWVDYLERRCPECEGEAK
jgi:hypothetical protein